jgi:hypothetical protein
MNMIMFLFMAILAFLLSPGILVSLPPGGSRKITAVTHAVVLALVYALTHKFIYKTISN